MSSSTSTASTSAALHRTNLSVDQFRHPELRFPRHHRHLKDLLSLEAGAGRQRRRYGSTPARCRFPSGRRCLRNRSLSASRRLPADPGDLRRGRRLIDERSHAAPAAADAGKPSAALRQKRLTFTAKILSKRARPTARSASATMVKVALPACTKSALRRRAAATRFPDRSIARIVLFVRRSLIAATATPCPQPISSSRSVGSGAMASSAQAIRRGRAPGDASVSSSSADAGRT